MASMTQPASPRLVAPAPLRFVTATSIFDGHDAAINIIRRLLQAQGAEVVHLGHNRGVEDIVRAALQEDAVGPVVGPLPGEAAMFDGSSRSATAIAAEDAVVFSLARSDLDALAATSPALAIKLLVNLGRHLSTRLRQTTDTLRDLVDSRG